MCVCVWKKKKKKILKVNVHNLGFGNGFLDYDTKSISNKRKNKLDFITIKNIYASRNTKKKMKRPTEWRKNTC